MKQSPFIRNKLQDIYTTKMCRPLKLIFNPLISLLPSQMEIICQSYDFQLNNLKMYQAVLKTSLVLSVLILKRMFNNKCLINYSKSYKILRQGWQHQEVFKIWVKLVLWHRHYKLYFQLVRLEIFYCKVLAEKN